MEKRLIYADELMEEFNIETHIHRHGEMWHITGIEAVIGNAPTVDAVEVVRCGECFYGRYHKDIEAIEDGKCICCDIHSSFVGKSDFCSYGERRSEMIALEDTVDLDAINKANGAAMRRVIDFVVGERRSDE